MSENKALKKENGQKPKVETTEEEVEGYAYCASFKQKCINDCLPDYATPLLTDLNYNKHIKQYINLFCLPGGY